MGDKIQKKDLKHGRDIQVPKENRGRCSDGLGVHFEGARIVCGKNCRMIGVLKIIYLFKKENDNVVWKRGGT